MKTKDSTFHVGNLKKRGAFEYYDTTVDAYGGTEQTWNAIDTVWMDIKALSGSEALRVEALKGNIRYEIVTRYRDDLIDKGYSRETYDYDLRMKYNGSIYNIEYAYDKGEENAYTYMIATREVGDEV